MPDTSGAISLDNLGIEERPLTAEEEEALSEMAEKHPPEEQPEPRQKVHSAFLIIVSADGSVSVAPHQAAADIVPQVTPSDDMIYGAVCAVQKDIQAVETAQATVQVQMMQMQQMVQQGEAQRLAASLNLPGQGRH